MIGHQTIISTHRQGSFACWCRSGGSSRSSWRGRHKAAQLAPGPPRWLPVGMHVVNKSIKVNDSITCSGVATENCTHWLASITLRVCRACDIGLIG